MSSRRLTPPQRYVFGFLNALSRSNDGVRLVRQSEGLPPMDTAPQSASFERFRNILKVMSELNPVPYQTPKQGRFAIEVPDDDPEKRLARTYDVLCRFDDSATDPSVEIRLIPTGEVFRPPASECL